MQSKENKEDSGLSPNFLLEQELINNGKYLIAGTDEVGRGSWAGPVTAATVILDPKEIPLGIDDSKRISKFKSQKQLSHVPSTTLLFTLDQRKSTS